MFGWTLLQLGVMALLLLCGVWLCFGGVLVRRLAFGVHNLVWVLLGAGLVAAMFFEVPLTDKTALMVAGGTAVAAAGLSAIWLSVGGALAGFFFVSVGGMCALWLLGLPSIAVVPAAIFVGLIIGVVGCYWPKVIYFAVVPLSGAVFIVLPLLVGWRAPQQLYFYLQELTASEDLMPLIRMGIVAGVLWVAGMVLQTVLAVKAYRKRRAAEREAEAAALAEEAALQQAQAEAAQDGMDPLTETTMEAASPQPDDVPAVEAMDEKAARKAAKAAEKQAKAAAKQAAKEAKLAARQPAVEASAQPAADVDAVYVTPAAAVEPDPAEDVIPRVEVPPMEEAAPLLEPAAQPVAAAVAVAAETMSAQTQDAAEADAPSAQPADGQMDGSWQCSCGHTNSFGRFCAGCGSPRP